MLADLDIEEQFAYFERLNKSADPMTRERAQAELDRLATVDIEKVGPKGYIHGWIFVGAPGVGGRVYHPHHGHGTITRHGKRTVGVRFDSGKEHAFEHGTHPSRVGETSGHFGQRLDGRTGKPVKTPEVAEVKTPEVAEVKPEIKPSNDHVAKPKTPKAPKERAPGEARRGDIVLVHTQRLEGTRDGRGRTAHRLSVAEVTSVSREGKVTAYRHTDAGPDTRPYRVANDTRSTQYHIIPQEKIDTAAALAAYRERTWAPGGTMSKPYDSLGEAREAMKPYLREEKPKEPEAPDHLALAHTAIKEGRHADAVNHLSAAAEAAPDKASRDAILAQRAELAGRLMGKKPEPEKPKAPEVKPEIKAPQEKINYGDQTPATNVERLKPHQLRTGMRLRTRVREDPNHPDEYGDDKPERWVTLGLVANARRPSYSRQNMSPSAGMYHLYDTHGNFIREMSPNHRITTDADVQPTSIQERSARARITTIHNSGMTPGSRPEQRLLPSEHAVNNLGAPAPQMLGHSGRQLDPLDPNYGYPSIADYHRQQSEIANRRGLPALAEVHQGHAAEMDAKVKEVQEDRAKYGEPERPKPKVPERPMRSAREEVKDASGVRTVGEGEHERGAATDYVVQQHPAVRRAEQGVYRSAGGMDGTPTPAAVKALHDAYRVAGAKVADERARDAWSKLDRSQQHAAITDPVHGDKVLAHLAATHYAARVRNDPAASAEAKKSAAEKADKAMRDIHSVQAITERRERQDVKRTAARDRINAGDATAAVDLLPPKADDRVTRRIAEAITPQVDPALSGKRLQAATAVRNAQVEVARAKMTEDAARNRVEARRSLGPATESPSVKAALDAEGKRNVDEWVAASKAHEDARARLAEAKDAAESAEAEHKVMVGKQHTEVMNGMRAEFDKIGELPKSTEGKDIAKEAGVPRTITRLTGYEKELAREVNKRADILNEGLDKSKRFNRQADVVEATHARLSGTLHPEVQDRLDALYDQARDQRGEGSSGIYRENLNEAIGRWNLFQRAKNGVPPRDEQEMQHRETLANQLDSTFGLARGREPELAARIRAGNVQGGAPRAIESEEAALPIPDLPKPRARASREYKEPTGLEPGAKVSWTHHHEDGTTTERTGRVWSKAPKPSNTQDAAWVTPDEPLPSDPYSAVVVHQARRTKKGTPVTFESHDSDTSHSGSLGRTAANIAARHRATGKAFRPIDPLIEAAIEHALSAAA